MLDEKFAKELIFAELHLTNHISSLDQMIVDIHKRETIKDRHKESGEHGDILEGENGRNLKKALNLKANKNELEHLFKLKSDKNVTDNV